MDSRANSFTGLVVSLDALDFDNLQKAVKERRCREKIGIGTIEEAIERHRLTPSCPLCKGKVVKNGKTPTGKQRYLCRKCDDHFSSLTGTVLEYCKKDLPTWVDFITLMCHNASLDLAVEMCGIAHTTAFEWRHRVLRQSMAIRIKSSYATVSG